MIMSAAQQRQHFENITEISQKLFSCVFKDLTNNNSNTMYSLPGTLLRKIVTIIIIIVINIF